MERVQFSSKGDGDIFRTLLATFGDVGTPSVIEAIDNDPALTTRQRQALLEIYRSFLDQNDDEK